MNKTKKFRKKVAIKQNILVYLVMIHENFGNKIPPFPLMLLSKVLKDKGFDVKVVHCTEKDINKWSEKIISDTPLLVGFSVLTGLPTVHSAMMSKRIKEACKKNRTSVPIVWGGVHPSLLPEQCLKEDYIDYIIKGEGEIALAELLDHISADKEPKDIPGVGYKKDGKLIINATGPFIKELDDYSYDFDCINLDDYAYSGEYDVGGKKVRIKTIGYYGSRGCPHNCGFCYNLVYNQRRWRAYSAQKVIDDISYLKREHGIKCIDFWDDNFFVDKKRALQILESIDCYSKIEIRIDYIDEALAKRLYELKVVYMLIGGESGSDKILDLMKKGFTSKKLLDGAKILEKYRLAAQYSFILGIPSETKEQLYETIDLMYAIRLMHKKASFTVGMYLPYPGTELYGLSLKLGFKQPESTEEWNKVDRWRNTVDLPWANNKVCLNIRHLFAMLSWRNPFIRKWAAFRIKHCLIDMNVDLKLIIRLHLLAEKLKR